MVKLKAYTLVFKLIKNCSLVLALEMSIACILAVKLGVQLAEISNLKSPVVSALWCTISTIIVMQATWQKSLEAGINRIIGSGFGSAIPAIFLSYFGTGTTTFVACIVTLVMLCSILNKIDSLRLALLTMAVIYIVCKLNSGLDILDTSFSRFIESLLGIAITMVVRSISIPLHTYVDRVIKTNLDYNIPTK
jgi:uncharacterized membrane protein YgaE (UPF0421/DUF939 family)